MEYNLNEIDLLKKAINSNDILLFFFFLCSWLLNQNPT